MIFTYVLSLNKYHFNKILNIQFSPPTTRAATIVLREDNCHFLRVDKEDFNRILRVRSFYHKAVDKTLSSEIKYYKISIQSRPTVRQM